jgi:hypothetical protein
VFATDLPVTIPPTPAQHEIYLAAQLDDRASCAFNEQITLTFDGTLNAAHLSAALNDVIARHDALRATFGTTGEHMTVAPSLTLALPHHDLTHAPNPLATLAAALSTDASTAFDLAHGPLLRASLFSVSPTSHVLAFTAHHIICDGWSMNTITTELTQFYTARLNATAPDLAPALPFRTFAATEISAETPANRAFWTSMYHDMPEPLDLPSDRPRPVLRTWSGATLTETIDAPTARALKQMAANNGATLFSALFASLQLVLGRLASADDVVLTVPMAAQTKLDGESLVGHAVNFLPMRVGFDTAQPFASHLKSVHAALRSALAHQDYTLGSLVRDLTLKRTINRTPLGDVQFNFEKLPTDLDVPGARVRMAAAAKTAVNFDLFFNIAENRDSLDVAVDYNTDLYDAETIHRWIGHLRTAITNATATPDAPIATIDILSAADRENLLADSATTPRHDNPRPFRTPSPPHTRRHRGDLGGQKPHLRRTRRRSQPSGPPSPAPGQRQSRPRRDCRRTFNRHAGRPPRRYEIRPRLRAA